MLLRTLVKRHLDIVSLLQEFISIVRDLWVCVDHFVFWLISVGIE